MVILNKCMQMILTLGIMVADSWSKMVKRVQLEREYGTHKIIASQQTLLCKDKHHALIILGQDSRKVGCRQMNF